MLHRIPTDISYTSNSDKRQPTEIYSFKLIMYGSESTAPLNTSGGYSDEVKECVDKAINKNNAVQWAIRNSGHGLYMKKELYAQSDQSWPEQNLVKFTFVVHFDPPVASYFKLKYSNIN